jgi:hypothetical protein
MGSNFFLLNFGLLAEKINYTLNVDIVWFQKMSK